MGTIFSLFKNSESPVTKRVWPIRYFNQANNSEELSVARFGHWDPRLYMQEFKYPAKEPAKDF